MNAEQIKAIVQSTFNAVADGYDDPVLRFFPACAKQLADLLELRGDERVLDVGLTAAGRELREQALAVPAQVMAATGLDAEHLAGLRDALAPFAGRRPA